jgi:hypothetical protein
MSVLGHSTFIQDWNIDQGSLRFSPIIFSERRCDYYRLMR